MSVDPGRRFYVDVLSRVGLRLGSGPLANVLYVEQSDVLDQAGTVKFGLPAADAQALALLANESLVRVRTAEGSWPACVVQSRMLRPGARPTYDISGLDLIYELGLKTTGLARTYDNIQFALVLEDLLKTTNPVWDLLVTDRSFETIVHKFDGETVLAAFAFVVDRMDCHFRYDYDYALRRLMVGQFGEDCGIRLVNTKRVTVDLELNPDIQLLTDLELVEESTRIINWMVPMGSGDGRGQLTLASVDATHGGGVAGPYLVYVTSGINRGSTSGVVGTLGQSFITVTTPALFEVNDPIYIGLASYNIANPHGAELNEVSSVVGSTINLKAPLKNSYGSPSPSRAVCHAWPMFYIRDWDSINTLGLGQREIIQVWKDIAPIDNTDAAVMSAANTLYDCACSFLRKNKLSNVTYRANVNWLPLNVRAGDQIRLVYSGSVVKDGSPISYLDVDDLYTILSVTRRIESNGVTKAQVEIASVDKPLLDNIGVVVHALQSVGDWELRTQNYPACIQDTTEGPVSNNTKHLYTPIRFSSGGFIMGVSLDRATVTLKTDVLSFVSETYEVIPDTVYPSDITLHLVAEVGSEIDITSMLGGPWGTSGASFEVTLDITQLLRNNLGGLKQSHRLRWACAVGSRGLLEVTTRLAFSTQSFVRG